ncbi:MAG: hypothetical protein JWP02_3952 [Acidimicrobiales bacterium]|nr:hypothetical protein [Acidimicrobiales bacterium]
MSSAEDLSLASRHRPRHVADARSEAARRDAEWLRRWTDSLVSRSTRLAAEIDGVLARSADAHRRAWETRLRARAMRDWSEALRGRADPPPTGGMIGAPVRWFSLTGELGRHQVAAEWQYGRLSRCDPHLLTQARLLVELGTVFVNDEPPAQVPATLTGPPAAVMLTLARACDTVFSVDFEAAEDG